MRALMGLLMELLMELRLSPVDVADGTADATAPVLSGFKVAPI